MNEQAEKDIQNPYQVLFWNPHIHAQKFAKMATKFHNEKELEMLSKIAGLTNRLLCESSEINWRQRIKYKDWGFQIGRKKFYLLPN